MVGLMANTSVLLVMPRGSVSVMPVPVSSATDAAVPVVVSRVYSVFVSAPVRVQDGSVGGESAGRGLSVGGGEHAGCAHCFGGAGVGVDFMQFGGGGSDHVQLVVMGCQTRGLFLVGSTEVVVADLCCGAILEIYPEQPAGVVV